ncbi:MAG TPA: flagellar assembly protein FliW [Bryobacteraceae bacterium]
MPDFATSHIGLIHYDEPEVIEFPEGLPGLEDQTRFLPLEHASTRPLAYVQSLTRPDLCFLTLPVLGIDPGYSLKMSPENLRTLGLPEERQPAIGSEVLCLAIICLTENQPPTANLRAPLVVRIDTRRGVQAIRDDETYSHRHVLLAPEPVSA